LVGKTRKERIGESTMLFLTRKGIKAEAFLREDGQIQVLKGSTAVFETTPSFERHPYKPLRDDLIKIGKLIPKSKYYEFIDDYIFNSASAAAAVILGNSANGKLEWKNKDNKTLKEIFN